MSATRKLYHGSPENVEKLVVERKGIFGGVFCHGDKGVAESHGEHVYEVELDESDIVDTDMLRFELDYDVVFKAFFDVVNPQTEYFAEILWEAIIEETLPYGDYVEVADALGINDIAEASWECQRLRGLIAAKLGYKAVSCEDEHGKGTFLILPGIELTPAQDDED